MKSFSYDKVVLWGYPLYSHTASYGWEAYQKAFDYLGYEVYWFHDDDFPTDFDFSNTMFSFTGKKSGKIIISYGSTSGTTSTVNDGTMISSEFLHL